MSRLGHGAAALALAAVVNACAGAAGWPHDPSGSARAALGAPELEVLLLGADDARRRALGGADAAGLESFFAGAALEGLRRRVAVEHARGYRLQEEAAARRLVHFRLPGRGGDGEGVVALSGRVRMAAPGRADASWSATAAQWWARVEPAAGGWRVVEEADLPPPRWWPW